MGKKKEKAPSFAETAREIGADETPGFFEKAFSKIVPPKRPEPKAKNKKSLSVRDDT